MIKSIEYKHYRKLKDIKLEFSPNINVVSGTNGTCKTSILHTISNSFQQVTSTTEWVNEKKSLSTIKKLNKLWNPKLETLTRGDKKFNDPANGEPGALYVTKYLDDSELSFRKHNSKNGDSTRFSVKPIYKQGKNESLPALPTIYLGLFRLFSYGEFDSDDLIENISSNLPEEYLIVLTDLYKEFTGYDIAFDSLKNMGNIKNRPEFKTSAEGIDSNTISAGEDNLFILLTALVSLRYYFDSIDSNREVESVFLIDEIDASLHPAYQVKLFNLFEEYSTNYKIQIFFTTHSISLLEYALKKSKRSVIYLIDNINKVSVMRDPDRFKIDMFLKSITAQERYLDSEIPVFTEDAEARVFLELLISHYNEVYGIDISKLFHFVNANFSSETIKHLAEDQKLLKSTLRSVHILDGDQNTSKQINNHLISLPGNKNPEELAFNYAKSLLNQDSDFWENDTLISQGYSKIYFRDNILTSIEEIETLVTKNKANGVSNKGIIREKNKKIFNKDLTFWRFILNAWIQDPQNQESIKKFFIGFRIIFLKSAEFHGLNPAFWPEI